MVVVQTRPVRLRWQRHQPDRDAQRVSAPRTPKRLHGGSVTFRSGKRDPNMHGNVPSGRAAPGRQRSVNVLNSA
ncbi:hypothetical protein JCM9533A_09450 [Catenuloplanes niger JCM 9533]